MYSVLSAVALFAAAAVAAPALSPRATTFTGDMTFFEIGLGSCGTTNTDADAVVALSVEMMQNGANPNANPLCGQTITISFGGSTHTATIVDTCQACAVDDIDVSPSLFSAVDPSGNGRVPGVNWSFDS